jgi:hypothetical protein
VGAGKEVVVGATVGVAVGCGATGVALGAAAVGGTAVGKTEVGCTPPGVTVTKLPDDAGVFCLLLPQASVIANKTIRMIKVCIFFI